MLVCWLFLHASLPNASLLTFSACKFFECQSADFTSLMHDSSSTELTVRTQTLTPPSANHKLERQFIRVENHYNGGIRWVVISHTHTQTCTHSYTAPRIHGNMTLSAKWHCRQSGEQKKKIYRQPPPKKKIDRLVLGKLAYSRKTVHKPAAIAVQTVGLLFCTLSTHKDQKFYPSVLFELPVLPSHETRRLQENRTRSKKNPSKSVHSEIPERK